MLFCYVFFVVKEHYVVVKVPWMARERLSYTSKFVKYTGAVGGTAGTLQERLYTTNCQHLCKTTEDSCLSRARSVEIESMGWEPTLKFRGLH